MVMKDPGFAGTTLAVTQTIALWTVLMPPVSEVHAQSPGNDTRFVDDLRQTELVVGGVSVVVGLVMSRMERSWFPLVASAILVGTLIGAYEYTLRKNGHSAPFNLIQMEG